MARLSCSWQCFKMHGMWMWAVKYIFSERQKFQLICKVIKARFRCQDYLFWDFSSRHQISSLLQLKAAVAVLYVVALGNICLDYQNICSRSAKIHLNSNNSSNFCEVPRKLSKLGTRWLPRMLGEKCFANKSFMSFLSRAGKQIGIASIFAFLKSLIAREVVV